ncbi:DUF2844 domain-containing protein [Ramlibacter aquaticus]|uniref:DUF2844 domain-containing protein n=1 Tax=Ramlibacter aquaticus TaxID=2780094 RepID=A0ABR9SKF1_9BURK|nr:DUF2844 domain-containing protein [Ramlibacter aquaticus]MBE7942836.1 DUF2844 domain-containing protein [Ramlibacter aquaticus]
MTRRRWIPVAACLAASWTAAAHAELGSLPQAGAAAVASAPTWRQWQSQQADGTVINEFAGADGQVFALSWQGPVKPDLRALLGPRFQAFLARAGRPRGPGAAHVTTQDFVVSSSGHMGAFQGAAWIPSRLPAGFDPASPK